MGLPTKHAIPCQVCGALTKVTDTRQLVTGDLIGISRKRVCLTDKKHRFSTIELPTSTIDACFRDKKFNLKLLARSLISDEIDRFAIWVKDKYRSDSINE